METMRQDESFWKHQALIAMRRLYVMAAIAGTELKAVEDVVIALNHRPEMLEAMAYSPAHAELIRLLKVLGRTETNSYFARLYYDANEATMAYHITQVLIGFVGQGRTGRAHYEAFMAVMRATRYDSQRELTEVASSCLDTLVSHIQVGREYQQVFTQRYKTQLAALPKPTRSRSIRALPAGRRRQIQSPDSA